jgi:hypothetical protein
VLELVDAVQRQQQKVAKRGQGLVQAVGALLAGGRRDGDGGGEKEAEKPVEKEVFLYFFLQFKVQKSLNKTSKIDRTLYFNHGFGGFKLYYIYFFYPRFLFIIAI